MFNLLEDRLFYSVVRLPYGARGSGVRMMTEKNPLFPKYPYRSGAQPISYSVGSEVLSRGKAAEVWSYSSPSSTDVKNEWSYASTPPLCLHGSDRDNFKFFICSLYRFVLSLLMSYSNLQSTKIPIRTKFSAPVQTGPGTHTASRRRDSFLFLKGRADRTWSWSSTPSSAKVKK